MHKNKLVFILTLISGIVIGSFIGDALSKVPYFTWLNYGKTIGLTSPFYLDLSVFTLQLAFTFNFTIASIIGMVIAIIIYKKL